MGLAVGGRLRCGSGGSGCGGYTVVVVGMRVWMLLVVTGWTSVGGCPGLSVSSPQCLWWFFCTVVGFVI